MLGFAAWLGPPNRGLTLRPNGDAGRSGRIPRLPVHPWVHGQFEPPPNQAATQARSHPALGVSLSARSTGRHAGSSRHRPPREHCVGSGVAPPTARSLGEPFVAW